MSSVQPPPIINPVIDEAGIATLPWILFFNQVFGGDTGTFWTPVFQNLTIVGTPTITGKYFRLGSLVYFWVLVTPATNTSAVAGTTYVTFPLDVLSDGACFAVSGLLGGSVGMVEASTNRIYPPAWTTVTVPLTVIGLVEAQ